MLSRSVIAVASLAIGSVTLAAVPVAAATPSGITREQVLAAAAGARSASPTAEQTSARDAIVLTTCATSGTRGIDFEVAKSEPMIASDGADGAVMTVVDTLDHQCKVAAFATVDPTFELSGTVTIDGTENESSGDYPPRTLLFKAPLSGDVFVTAPVEANKVYDFTASAVGSATRTTTSPTRTTVPAPKTTSRKKAAKKTFDKRLKSAKKACKKALEKAASSKNKRAKAKKAYRTAIANGSTIVDGTMTITENRPFSLSSR